MSPRFQELQSSLFLHLSNMPVTLPSIEETKTAATTVNPQETPEQTMARIKSELAAKGEKTGAERQLAIERAAGIPSVRAPGPGVPTEQTIPPSSFTKTVLTS